MNLYAALAEKERRVIAERTRLALAGAKATGARLGNPHHPTKRERSAGAGYDHAASSSVSEGLAPASLPETLRPLSAPKPAVDRHGRRAWSFYSATTSHIMRMANPPRPLNGARASGKQALAKAGSDASGYGSWREPFAFRPGSPRRE
jgi:hypothetical protein